MSYLTANQKLKHKARKLIMKVHVKEGDICLENA